MIDTKDEPLSSVNFPLAVVELWQSLYGASPDSLIQPSDGLNLAVSIDSIIKDETEAGGRGGEGGVVWKSI